LRLHGVGRVWYGTDDRERGFTSDFANCDHLKVELIIPSSRLFHIACVLHSMALDIYGVRYYDFQQ
jgi:hypothetical protein